MKKYLVMVVWVTGFIDKIYFDTLPQATAEYKSWTSSKVKLSMLVREGIQWKRVTV
jgi:hypothetical protein